MASRRSTKPKKTPKRKSNKGVSSRTVSPKGGSVKVEDFKHDTNRYKTFGRPKGATPTRATAKRATISKMYPCTVAELEKKWGFSGLRNAAKHAQLKRVKINGLRLPATRDDVSTAKLLGKLPGSTRIVPEKGKKLNLVS
jgi:hypothetical protein